MFAGAHAPPIETAPAVSRTFTLSFASEKSTGGRAPGAVHFLDQAGRIK
jgi:hypothetical protein